MVHNRVLHCGSERTCAARRIQIASAAPHRWLAKPIRKHATPPGGHPCAADGDAARARTTAKRTPRRGTRARKSPTVPRPEGGWDGVSPNQASRAPSAARPASANGNSWIAVARLTRVPARSLKITDSSCDGKRTPLRCRRSKCGKRQCEAKVPWHHGSRTTR